MNKLKRGGWQTGRWLVFCCPLRGYNNNNYYAIIISDRVKKTTFGLDLIVFMFDMCYLANYSYYALTSESGQSHRKSSEM